MAARVASPFGLNTAKASVAPRNRRCENFRAPARVHAYSQFTPDTGEPQTSGVWDDGLDQRPSPEELFPRIFWNQIEANQVSLIGTLGNQPEMTQLSSGLRTSRLSIAINSNKAKQTPAEWVDVDVWEDLAESCQSLSKGTRICVRGTLKVSSWQDKSTGLPRKRVAVVAKQIALVVNANDVASYAAAGYAAPVYDAQGYEVPSQALPAQPAAEAAAFQQDAAGYALNHQQSIGQEYAPREQPAFAQQEAYGQQQENIEALPVDRTDYAGLGLADAVGWQDLARDPTQFFDNRESKWAGNPKRPDYVHKRTRTPLWLNAAPGFIRDDPRFQPKKNPNA